MWACDLVCDALEIFQGHGMMRSKTIGNHKSVRGSNALIGMKNLQPTAISVLLICHVAVT